jgi:Protein of unknown function (DUF3828)
MPGDRAQSKALNGAFPSNVRLAQISLMPMMTALLRRLPYPAMPTRRTLILSAVCVAPLALGRRASAADASALAFVNDIYSAYKGKDAKGHPLDGKRAIRRYFEPSLATLMVRDQKLAAKRGEVGLLDFDPFIDAQDWDIATFDIAIDDAAPGKATATVMFTNLDKPATVLLGLVKIKNWRVADITWLRDGKRDSLRKLYAH